MSDSQFKSVYKDDLADYLAISEGTIGEEALRNTCSILQSFDSLLTEEDTIEISEEVINRWIEALTKINSPKTVSDKVSYLRKFLRYLQYKGYSVFMPACPKTTDDYIPYIFSEEEIRLLLACADNLAARLTNSKGRQTAIEFCMLLRMLIGCGFRRGELLAAKVKDVNFSQGTILIRHAKNNKQRIVPMNSALTDMLERYCIALGIKMKPDSFLFPSSRKKGTATSGSTFSMYFRELLRETGLYIPRKEHSRGQCLHCFRHYFANSATTSSTGGLILALQRAIITCPA